MKKKIFTLLALFACVLSASAQTTSTLAVKDAYVLSGGTGTINLELNNPDETYVGYSFTLTLPAGIVPQIEMKNLLDAETNTTKPTEVVKADMGTRHAATHALRTNITVNGDGTRTIGFVVLSGSSDIIKDKSGVLMQIYVETTLAASSTPLAGKISNAKFSNGVTDAEPADVNFNIIVTDKVILDEESTAAPVTYEDAVDVLVKRNLKANIWNTLCLPFKITKTQAETIFGTDVKVAEIETITSTGDNYTVKFKSRTASNIILANKIYIIKPSKDVEEFELNTAVSPVESPKVDYEDEDEGIMLGTAYGTLRAGITIPKDHIFISSNKFYYSTGSSVIKGFRGYFYIKDFKSSSSAPEFVVDGETTNIEGLQILTDDGQFYNLKGQKVDNPTQKGVYIQNGKKVVVK